MIQKSTKGKALTQADKKLISALSSLPKDYWDFKDNDVREYTHGIHNYPAVMVSPISRNIIKLVKDIRNVETIFDPFMGSGTVLVEGMLAGINNIYGNDINPLALFLSKVKTTRLDITQLRQASQTLYDRIKDAYDQFAVQINGADEAMRNVYHLDLTAKNGWGADAPKYLHQYTQDHHIQIEIPEFKNIGYWFKPRVILLLSLIKGEINKITNKDIRDFIFVAFSETIRFVSNRRNGEFKMFRMPVNKVDKFEPDVIKEFTAILDRNIEKMDSFDKACGDIGSNSTVSLFSNNATSLEDVPDHSVDLVVTSPPYGDSRTTVAYGEYSRLSLQWLDLFELSEKEIMGIDKALMGGNKYKTGFESAIPSVTLKASLDRIRDVDLERAGDVYSFYLDLCHSIAAISDKTRPGGYQFWVVGNRTVKGELLLTDRIISEIAHEYGLEHIYTIDRNIINKVMPSLNSPTNESGVKSSTMTNEHIVVLRKKAAEKEDRAMIDTLEDFVGEYTKIKEMGWIQTHRSGSTGIGKTLEDLLGIPENNLDQPDFGDYELKSCRIDSKSMLTMFTRAPQPTKANTYLCEKYGYPSRVNDNDAKVLHATLSADRFTPIAGTGNMLKIHCKSDGIYIESQDGIENVFWSREALRKSFEKKYKNKFVYAKALTRGKGSNEEFHFIEAYEVSGFDYDAFIALLEAGKICVDLRIGQFHHGKNKGKTHDHGTAFRIREIDQPLLFQVQNRIV